MSSAKQNIDLFPFQRLRRLCFKLNQCQGKVEQTKQLQDNLSQRMQQKLISKSLVLMTHSKKIQRTLGRRKMQEQAKDRMGKHHWKKLVWWTVRVTCGHQGIRARNEAPHLSAAMSLSRCLLLAQQLALLPTKAVWRHYDLGPLQLLEVGFLFAVVGILEMFLFTCYHLFPSFRYMQLKPQ